MTESTTAMLQKGLLFIIFGAAIAVLPYVLTAPTLHTVLFAFSLLGWFLLAMGGTLAFRHLRPRKPSTNVKPVAKL